MRASLPNSFSEGRQKSQFQCACLEPEIFLGYYLRHLNSKAKAQTVLKIDSSVYPIGFAQSFKSRFLGEKVQEPVARKIGDSRQAHLLICFQFSTGTVIFATSHHHQQATIHQLYQFLFQDCLVSLALLRNMALMNARKQKNKKQNRKFSLF